MFAAPIVAGDGLEETAAIIIEKSDTHRFLIERALSPLGFRSVQPFGDAETARRHIARSRVDLVVVGHASTSEFDNIIAEVRDRRSGSGRRVLVIVVSNPLPSGRIKALSRLTVDDIILVPFQLEILQSRVLALLQRRLGKVAGREVMFRAEARGKSQESRYFRSLVNSVTLQRDKFREGRSNLTLRRWMRSEGDWILPYTLMLRRRGSDYEIRCIGSEVRYPFRGFKAGATLSSLPEHWHQSQKACYDMVEPNGPAMITTGRLIYRGDRFVHGYSLVIALEDHPRHTARSEDVLCIAVPNTSIEETVKTMAWRERNKELPLIAVAERQRIL